MSFASRLAAGLACAVAVGLFALAPAPASAAVCPDDGSGTRTVTLTSHAGATCHAFGTGSLTGNATNPNIDPILASIPGLFLLDKANVENGQLVTEAKPNAVLAGAIQASFTQSDVGGKTIGSLSFDLGSNSYPTLILGLKFGASKTPHWVAFALPAGLTGLVTASWEVDPKQGGGLSAATLSAIPLPAAAWLMLAGLGGLGAVARRRTAAA